MRPANVLRARGGIGFAPRSKAELAKLTIGELRELADKVGVVSSGDKAAVIRRIEEKGVAYVADKSKATEVDPGANVDPDAVAIADSTLASLPEDHPGWNGPQISKEDIRNPAQADEPPNANHRPPEAREGKPEFADAEEAEAALGTPQEHDSAPMEDSEVHGKPASDK